MQISPSPYQKLSIETPENIQLDYELAAPGSRFMAYMIDYFIMNMAISILSFAFYYVSINIGNKFSRDIIMFIIFSVYAIFYLLGGYFIIFETIWSGQTPGKKYVGIRVIQDNGLPVTFTQVVFRNIARLIDCNFPIQYGVGIAYMLSDRNTRRIGDVVANTVVVKNKKPITMTEALAPQPALSPNFDVVQFYTTLPFDYHAISTTELSMMKEFWDIKNEISQNRAFELVRQLVPPILKRLGLTNDSHHIDPELVPPILKRLGLTNDSKYTFHHIDPETKMNGYYLFIRDVLRAYKYEDLSPFNTKTKQKTKQKTLR